MKQDVSFIKRYRWRDGLVLILCLLCVSATPPPLKSTPGEALRRSIQRHRKPAVKKIESPKGAETTRSFARAMVKAAPPPPPAVQALPTGFYVTLTRSNKTVFLSWVNGTGPYQVQQTVSVNPVAWVNIGNPTMQTNAAFVSANPSAYFRVQQLVPLLTSTQTNGLTRLTWGVPDL